MHKYHRSPIKTKAGTLCSTRCDMGAHITQEETRWVSCSHLSWTVSSASTASGSFPPHFTELSDTASSEHEPAVCLSNTRIHVQIIELSEEESCIYQATVNLQRKTVTTWESEKYLTAFTREIPETQLYPGNLHTSKPTQGGGRAEITARSSE